MDRIRERVADWLLAVHIFGITYLIRAWVGKRWPR